MNYYQRHIGDYTSKTSHLSLLEHGVYAILMDRYYTSEAPIPDGQKYRLACARSKDEKAAVDAILAEFFNLDGDVWRQHRCDQVIADRHEFLAKQAASGKASAAKRKSTTVEPEGNDRSTTVQRVLDSGTNQTPTKTQPPDPRSPTPVPRLGSIEPRESARGDFAAVQSRYPRFGGRQDWGTAIHHWSRLLDQGATEAELLAGVERYAAYVAAGGVSSPQYVLTPAKFFSAADKPWQQPWALPKTKAEIAQDANITASQQWLEAQSATG